LAAAVLFGPTVANSQEKITPEQVRTAIDKGVAYLKRQQRDDGSWPDWSVPVAGVYYPGGVTALSTLALLNAGVPPDDPAMRRALIYLRKLKPEKTYVVSLQTMVFCQATPTFDKDLIRRNVQWLVSRQVSAGPNKGAWSYSNPSAVGGDPSNAQFAMLALHEAERVGMAVDDRTWKLAKAYWEGRFDELHGAWRYRDGAPVTGSMTCAGIASLVIANDKIRQGDADVEGEQIRCCGEGEDDDDRIQRGLQWLAKHFSVEGNPGGPGGAWWLYYLYGVERVGRLTAQRFIGGHDWYREGSEYLVGKRQNRLTGSWIGVGHAEDNELIATSLALLFLAKGRRPILIAKLQHDTANDWNPHRNDVGNLTRYVESRWRIDMTHQVIDPHVAKVEDLLQAPVLFLCGQQSPLPPPGRKRDRLVRNLRDYLDRGGFLFAEACGNSAKFDAGFRELVKLIFPEEEYRLTELDAHHPIWDIEEPVRIPRVLLGINFGCRTSVVYTPPKPPSLSCLWELSRSGRGRQFPAGVQEQIDAGMAIGINVLTYATNRGRLLVGKEDTFRDASRQRPDQNVPRGQVTLAKLQHPGGCNAAPRALINLMDEAGKQLDIRTGARKELLDLSDPALFDYHMVFMHGRNRFRLLDAERAQLKEYIERGGILMADSICAASPFTESFRREMEAIFGEPLEPIPVDDPMLDATYGGSDLTTVTRRIPQRRVAGQPLKAALKQVPPELEGLKLGDRWAVIFSKYDISCALEKRDSLDCHGYVREDAAKIGLNVLLYSLQQ